MRARAVRARIKAIMAGGHFTGAIITIIIFSCWATGGKKSSSDTNDFLIAAVSFERSVRAFPLHLDLRFPAGMRVFPPKAF